MVLLGLGPDYSRTEGIHVRGINADHTTGSKKRHRGTSMTTIKLGKHSEESYGQPQIR